MYFKLSVFYLSLLWLCYEIDAVQRRKAVESAVRWPDSLYANIVGRSKNISFTQLCNVFEFFSFS